MWKEENRIESFIAERALKCLVHDMKSDIWKLKKEERESDTEEWMIQ